MDKFNNAINRNKKTIVMVILFATIVSVLVSVIPAFAEKGDSDEMTEEVKELRSISNSNYQFKFGEESEFQDITAYWLNDDVAFDTNYILDEMLENISEEVEIEIEDEKNVNDYFTKNQTDMLEKIVYYGFTEPVKNGEFKFTDNLELEDLELYTELFKINGLSNLNLENEWWNSYLSVFLMIAEEVGIEDISIKGPLSADDYGDFREDVLDKIKSHGEKALFHNKPIEIEPGENINLEDHLGIVKDLEIDETNMMDNVDVKVFDDILEIETNEKVKSGKIDFNKIFREDILDEPTKYYELENSDGSENTIIGVFGLDDLGTSSLELNVKESYVVNITRTGENNKRLSGSTIELYKVDGDSDELISEQTVNSNGVTLFEVSEPGLYYYIETVAPKGYELDNEKHEIEIVDMKYRTEVIYKTEPIVKTEDDVEEDEDKNEEESQDTGSIKINIVNVEMEPLKGVEFSLYTDYDYTELIDVGVTSEDGLLIFDNLKFGSYVYRITKVPKGYYDGPIDGGVEVADKSIIAEVSLALAYDEDNTDDEDIIDPPIDGGDNEDDIPMIPLEPSIPDDGGGNIDDEDKPIIPDDGDKDKDDTDDDKKPDKPGDDSDKKDPVNNGRVIITRIDKITGEPIKGSKIGLYNSRGKLIGESVTDNLGVLNIPVKKAGKYYHKEISTAETYSLDDTKHEVIIDNDGQIVSSEVTSDLIKIKGRKEDSDGNPLKDSVFGIYDDKDKLIFESKTDKNGLVEFDSLPRGTFVIKEISAPKGYQKTQDSYVLEITDTYKNTDEFTFIVKGVKLIKTGNDFPIVPFVIALMGVFGIVGVVVYKRKEI